MRKRCDSALQGVVIPSPWNLQTFLDTLAQSRQRQIVLSEAPELTTTTSAKWIKNRDIDFIFHAPTQSTFYLELNVFHEVGHMLCGHDLRHPKSLLNSVDLDSLGEMETLAGADGAIRTILSVGSNGAEPRIFSRSSRFDSVEEQEAELTAYRLKLMVEDVRCQPLAVDPATAKMQDIMRRTLGGH